MEFPHLQDTKFPNLDNVNTYEYKNIFDYTRWVPNTKIYLTNVRWNGDYSDVVKFDSDEERDKWFDKKAKDSDCSATITSNTVIVNGIVKVPMPYDVASQYNYLVVDVPVMTSNDDMIQYETADGYRRWHFFINDFSYGSPSTTTLTLSLDYWTQYINSVGISYMLLERGHAPVAKTDTDKYLENPMNNSKYLLAPDVNYGNDTIARGGKFIPWGNGEKYVCFASVCPPTELDNLGTVTEDAAYKWSKPTFSDDTDVPDETGRWNNEHKVEGYEWGNGKSYEGTKTIAKNNFDRIGRSLNNIAVYAVPGKDAQSFMNDVADKCPMFLNTVKACFIVAEEMLWIRDSVKFLGHTIYYVQGNNDIKDTETVTLTKEMFDIPEKYSRFAKLYTSPYSELEITDNNGKSVTVKVEDTGNINGRAIASLSYPYLNVRMFLRGIGGVGSDTYVWHDVHDDPEMYMRNCDWYKFCFDFDIPTYELYMDGETAWELGNYNRAYSFGRESALRSYYTSNERANNETQNAYDIADKTKTNADASADTAYNNTINTASAAKTNQYNDAETMDKNHGNSRDCASKITSNTNAMNTSNTSLQNEYQGDITTSDNARQLALFTHANTLSLQTTTEENQRTTDVATYEAMGSVGSGIVNGIAKGVSGDVAGGIGTVVSSLVDSAVTIGTAAATTNCNSAIQVANQGYNSSCYGTNSSYNKINNAYSVAYNSDVLENNVKCATANTDESNTCDSKNTDNTVSTMKTNADNVYDATSANADNTKGNVKANAKRDRETAKNNAKYSGWANRRAAKRVLLNTQEEAKALGKDARNYNPVTIGTSKGDFAPFYHRNLGIQIKVRTQSESAIAQTAAEFARYGYNLNQIVDMDNGLCRMKYFTYWKARDCWIYDVCETNDFAQTFIGMIFKNGVTVWSNPDKIGKVNPYDN